MLEIPNIIMSSTYITLVKTKNIMIGNNHINQSKTN